MGVARAAPARPASHAARQGGARHRHTRLPDGGRQGHATFLAVPQATPAPRFRVPSARQSAHPPGALSPVSERKHQHPHFQKRCLHREHTPHAGKPAGRVSLPAPLRSEPRLPSARGLPEDEDRHTGVQRLGRPRPAPRHPERCPAGNEPLRASVDAAHSHAPAWALTRPEKQPAPAAPGGSRRLRGKHRKAFATSNETAAPVPIPFARRDPLCTLRAEGRACGASPGEARNTAAPVVREPRPLRLGSRGTRVTSGDTGPFPL